MKTNKVFIAGTGLVGASMACALANEDIDITILDARPYSTIELQGSRPISLTYGSHLILKNLGLWEALAPSATPIKQVHVSDQGYFGATRIKAEDCNTPCLGYVIDLVQLHNALYEKVTKQKNVTLITPAEITQVEERETNVSIETTEGNFETPLLIAADGQQSFIRSQLHIDFKERPNKAAVIAQLSAEHHNTAYERFTAKGTIAMLPMPKNRCGMVWTLDNSDDLMALSDDEFAKHLQDTFGYRLGVLKDISKRHTITLKTGHALKQTQGHTVLLGNAAHTLHPVAAQGFNLSLNDVAALYDVIKEDKTLSEYASWRKKHQDSVSCYTNSLIWVFNQELLAHPRSLGLAALDTCPKLKATFAKFAMGLMGHQPSLAR